MLEEIATPLETLATTSEDAFRSILSRAEDSSGIGAFVHLRKDPEGRFAFELTPEGEELDRTYQRAARLADEKGMDDRDVLANLGEVESKWPSHPGIVENSINEAIESGRTLDAVSLCERAIADWARTISDAGVRSQSQLSISGETGKLFIQLLANYEFALERAEQLPQALGIAKLSRSLDPADPEHVLSSIVSLEIRSGNPMAALRALEPMAESLAPYVLYGRALAYFSLAQMENAQAAVQTALRHWPSVAQALTREWRAGTPMPRPGEQVSELQVLYGYFEVFGPAWKSQAGAIEWLREAVQTQPKAGGRHERYVGLTRTSQAANEPETAEAVKKAQDELIRKAQLIGEDEFVRFLEVEPAVYVYDLTERGKDLEEEHANLYRTDMKLAARIAAIETLLETWPGHANAAIALARFHAQKEHCDSAIDILERAIFDLQKFWPEDLVGAGRLPSDWPGNKPLLNAYAFMIVDLAESGDVVSAKAYADDYLSFNPLDNLGVRQKAIELAINANEYPRALQLINEASDPISAYNLFGRALLGYILKANDAEAALKNAVESRPLIWREMASDKHRMPHHYNPSWVRYFSPEEAYNYNEVWAPLWLKKHGALLWLKKEGRKYLV